ncbi:MAG: lipase family protein [Planctomycetaceae bacterium]
MPLSLIEDAYGDPRNVEALALASDLAYLPEDDARARFQTELGLSAQLICVDNTQAYVAQNQAHIVVAFRGTEAPTSIEGLKDWLLTDAFNLLVVPEGRLGTDLAAAGVGARFHQGFVNAIGEIWDPLYQLVEKHLQEAERPLWLTGHSLGGALAILAAWLFTRRTVSVHQIYTFGGPMVGNQQAVAALNREFAGKIFRFVNAPDPVPRLPMFSLIANDFAHCNEERILGRPDPEGSAAAFFKSFTQNASEKLLNANLIDDIWKGLQSRIGAHAMESYRELLRKL